MTSMGVFTRDFSRAARPSFYVSDNQSLRARAVDAADNLKSAEN